MNLPMGLEFSESFELSPNENGDWPLATAIAIPGVYLLAIRTSSGFIPFYAGESGNIAKRMKGHLKEYLTGGYIMYESGALDRGEFVRSWEPVGIEVAVKRMEELRMKCDEMIPRVWVLAAAMPNPYTTGERKIVESSLISYYKSLPQTRNHFENRGRSMKHPQIGRDITVMARCPTIGLPATLPI